ncbi:hypothetical protein O7602_25420 [Micromonospora sp. WMMD1128]|uniref:hypothetical protein n=1 Tax=Micromonospora sp. WMMD1128 TaxID=3015150 RepID=UPI00248CFA9B|nr:hypothetical protein [Micromonospora sp. WMMD1128]WBB72997.1 hypothetical protein O7602_25420 [Micromonospora sp. WMMD1128]
MTRARAPRRTLALFAPALVAAAAAVVAVAPGWAAATPAPPAGVVRAAGPDVPGDPGGDPGGEPTEPTPTEAATTTTAPAPPTEEAPTPTTPAAPAATTAPPTTTAPAPPTTTPTTTAPTTTAPAQPPVVPPVQPPPPTQPQPAAGPLGAQVSTDPAPTASQGMRAVAGRSGGPGTPARRIAIVLIVMSGLLVVFALTLATRSLRRRSDITVADPTADR